MMATNTRKPFFERLKTGLEEGIAHAKGERTLKTVDVPEAPPEVDAETLVALREQVCTRIASAVQSIHFRSHHGRRRPASAMSGSAVGPR
jgi:hypothetical protein